MSIIDFLMNLHSILSVPYASSHIAYLDTHKNLKMGSVNMIPILQMREWQFTKVNILTFLMQEAVSLIEHASMQNVN